MIDFQSIQTTTDLSSPARSALVLPARSVMPTIRLTRMTPTAPATPETPETVAFVSRDPLATCRASRGWTLPASGKSSHNTSKEHNTFEKHSTSEERNRLEGATSEGDSNTLGDCKVQDTEIEVTAASSA